MSTKATDWALGQRTGGPAEKAVLLILAIGADHAGMCSLSTREIAEAASTDLGTAYRVLGRLRDRALVSWTRGAGRLPNDYRLALVKRP